MSNKLKEKTCKFCGKKFTGASNRLTCGSDECKKLLEKQSSSRLSHGVGWPRPVQST